MRATLKPTVVPSTRGIVSVAESVNFKKPLGDSVAHHLRQRWRIHR